MVFGIVVEAERDANVYAALIRRIRPDVEGVIARPCQDVVRLRRSFVGWLKDFQWQEPAGVGKALVIRDSDCEEPRAREEELARILEESGFREKMTLPVEFYATRCMVETWLLSDEGAVNAAARSRGRNDPSAKPIADPLEGRRDAKELFRRMLSQAGLPADPKVYGEIAELADIGRLRRRCPYFERFIECIRDP